MQILETQIFPHDDRYLPLRWVKGSGLLGQYDHLDNLMLDLKITPAYGMKTIDKPGNSLIIGDPLNRVIQLNDKANKFNTRLLSSAKSSNQQHVKLYRQQHATLLGPDGGIRGKLIIGTNQNAAWTLITASYLPQDSVELNHFVAQADVRGEFVIDLSGIKMPDDGSNPDFTLSVQSVTGLTPDQIPNPDLFVNFQISTDIDVNNLATDITVTLDNYGGVKQLGDLLIAPI